MAKLTEAVSADDERVLEDGHAVAEVAVLADGGPQGLSEGPLIGGVAEVVDICPTGIVRGTCEITSQ